MALQLARLGELGCACSGAPNTSQTVQRCCSHLFFFYCCFQESERLPFAGNDTTQANTTEVAPGFVFCQPSLDKNQVKQAPTTASWRLLPIFFLSSSLSAFLLKQETPLHNTTTASAATQHVTGLN
jgi:hypothetical protein